MIPASSLFEVQDIPNAGRGVIAKCPIPAESLLLESGPPAFSVIFQQYKKETCAWCFLWDRGRTLPVKDLDTAKAFCSAECQSLWIEKQGEVGVEAWRLLAAFVRAKGKGTNADELMAEGPKPDQAMIDQAWSETEAHAKIVQESRSPPNSGQTTKASRKRIGALQQRIGKNVDANMLSYFLDGAILYYKRSKLVDEVMCLVKDDTPYRNENDLRNGCHSYLQLVSILPQELLSVVTPQLCRIMVQADNHNAFGIRGGGEDGEEYMGYGVYPCASYFNHSCEPNLKKRRVGRSWEFRAACDIAIGEECCISYLGGDEKDLSLVERQGRLGEVWGFACRCGRCTREGAEYT